MYKTERLSPEEIQQIAKYGAENSHETVLGRLMECFFEEMMAKFWARVKKHPGESSVTDDKYDWAGASITDGEHHLVYEFLERFPQYIDRFPEVNKSEVTIDPPETEDVDIANLAFYDWACRMMRQLKREQTK